MEYLCPLCASYFSIEYVDMQDQYVDLQDCKMYIVLRFKGYRVTTGNFFIEVIATFDISGLLMNMLF